MNSSIRYFLIALVCIVIGAGCLDANQTEVSSSANFYLQLNSIDSTLNSNDETLHVNRVRMIYGDGSVSFNDSTYALADDAAAYTMFTIPSPSNGTNTLRFFQAGSGTYSNFVLSIKPATDEAGNRAQSPIPSAFYQGGHYSIIIEGTYNDADFTFRSDTSFVRSFPLSAQIPETNASYAFLINADVATWFSNPSGGFYDPTDAENESEINSRIAGSFTLETQSSTNN